MSNCQKKLKNTRGFFLGGGEVQKWTESMKVSGSEETFKTAITQPIFIIIFWGEMSHCTFYKVDSCVESNDFMMNRKLWAFLHSDGMPFWCIPMECNYAEQKALGFLAF